MWPWKFGLDNRKFSFPWNYYFVFLFLLTFYGCRALECFQCASTAKDGGDCLTDHSGLVNASMRTANLGYIKNCTDTHTDPPFNRCFIEFHLGPDDEYVFYHRGCHDGVTFNKKVTSTRFVNLDPNNETTCAKPPGLLKEAVCFSFCQTNLCNGPRPPPKETDKCVNGSSYDGDTTCAVNGLHGNHNSSVFFASILAVLLMRLCLC